MQWARWGGCKAERISDIGTENHTTHIPNHHYVPLEGRLKWALPHLAMDLGLRCTGANSEVAKAKLFYHHPTVRARALGDLLDPSRGPLTVAHEQRC
jgi:hypothetical protein